MSSATANADYLKTLSVVKIDKGNGKFSYIVTDTEGESMTLIENSKRNVEAVTFWYSEGLENNDDDECFGITWICHSKASTAFKTNRNAD